MFSESEYLPLSGIQHFAFCRRQFALIHIESQWADNLSTVEGNILHSRAHDESIREIRGNIISVRGIRISSSSLGVSGQCDVLEFHKTTDGIQLNGHDGLWLPFPIEYKRGSPKPIDADRLQLCAQALCLEEMLCCDIPDGAIFYGETHKREVVKFSNELRQKVKISLEEMHLLYSKGYTPKVKIHKGCDNCSLKDICLPKLTTTLSVSEYIKSTISDSDIK